MAEMDWTTDATLASISAKWGMGGGTVTSIFGCLSENELLVGVGIITTILGFIMNWYFQYKRDKRSLEEHNLRKKLLEAQIQEIANHGNNSN